MDAFSNDLFSFMAVFFRATIYALISDLHRFIAWNPAFAGRFLCGRVRQKAN